MKRVILTLFVISTLFSANLMNGQTWKIDPAHSSILFNAKHSGISFVNGRFEKFEATVEGGTAEDFTNAKISFTAQVQSINTGVDGRDNHLRSADFFDMENHPTVTFKSTSFTKSGDGMYKVVGDLTMRGNTKQVELMAQHIGSIDTKDGGKKVGFQIKGSVDRNEFGVSGAGGSVAPTIEIICNVEMATQK
ncbi:YceI family protein [Roseivirga echinicomitans]|nr:YceI family protein [Roseivirga echinicomitans]